MLVLSRKESQRIRLGESVVVTVVKISGDKVRIGIDAPAEMLVLRDELEPHEPFGLTGPAERAVQDGDSHRTIGIANRSSRGPGSNGIIRVLPLTGGA